MKAGQNHCMRLLGWAAKLCFDSSRLSPHYPLFTTHFPLALFHTFPQPYQTNYSPPNSLPSIDLPQPHSNRPSPFE
jgi:hypothetical protein